MAICNVLSAALTTAAVAFTAAAPAQAQSYLASAPNAAGWVRVDRAGAAPKMAYTLTSSVTTFGKQGQTRTATGRATVVRSPKGDAMTLSSSAGSCQLSGDRGVCKLGGASFTVRLAPDLAKLTVLFVPGLSTNQWNAIGVPYMDENVATAKALGFAARRLAIRTENGVAANAAFIANEIRTEARAGRRVIVFAHSKGATDTTVALTSDPSLRASVLGVVAIQPVFFGSPVADFVASSKYLLMPAVKVVFEKLFGGQQSAVSDITTTARKAYVAAHPYPASLFPTVVVRSTFDRALSRSILWANQKAITLATRAPNDGMVRPEDATIPGAIATLDVKDMDHFEPGLRGESATTPVDLTRQTLWLLLYGR